MNSTNVTLGERLKVERQRLGFNQADFGSRVGVSKTSQFNYEAGGRVPDATYLQAAIALGVDVQFVLTGLGAASNDDFVLIRQHAVAASAGNGAKNDEFTEVGGLSFSRRWLSKRGLNPAQLEVINVSGESMTPKLNDGDKVLVDTSDTLPKSGRAYVLLQGDELLVKYCQLLPDGMLQVSSENSNYPTYHIDLARTPGVSIVGRVRASTHEW